MITGELKNKIDALWDIFAAGGLVNPLEVIEQITYLMFIHDLDEADNTRAKESAMLGLPYQSIFSEEVKIGERTISGNQLKWSVFHDFPADRMYSVMQEWVFPFIKTLHSDKNSAYSKYMDDAIFKLPTPLVLSKVVDSLDEIYAVMNEIQTTDVRGDVYEYLLSKSNNKPSEAISELFPVLDSVLYLICHGLIPYNRTCNKLRKHRNIQPDIENIPLNLGCIIIYIEHI